MAYNWTKGNNGILADEMGLGKTVQTVAFMSWVRDLVSPYFITLADQCKI